MPLLVQDVGDLGIDVIVEQLVDEFDDLRLGLHLLRGGFGILRRQRLGLAALEADMDLGRSFGRKFDQRDILDDVGEQSFAFAVRQARITPERFEVRRHGDQPIADRIVEARLVVLLAALPFLLRLGQCAQLVVPFALERIGDETVARDRPA